MICKVIVAGVFMHTLSQMASGTLVPLDSVNTDKLDFGIRKELLIQLNERIGQISIEYNKLKDTCERKIEKASAKCEGCVEEKKRQANSNAYKLLTLLFLPDIIFTEYLKFQEKMMKEVVGFLGDHSAKFLKGLSGLSKHVTSTLKDGIGDIGKTAIKGVEHLTKQLGNSVKDIAKVTVKTVENLNKGLGDLVTGTGKGLENLGKGLTDTAKNVAKAGSDALHNTAKATTQLLNGAAKTVGNVFKAVTNPIRSIRLPRIRIGGWGKKKRGLRSKETSDITEEMFTRSLDSLMKEAYMDTKEFKKEAERSSPEYRRTEKRILYEHFLDLGSCPTCDLIDTKKRSTKEIVADLCSDVKAKQDQIVLADKFARSLFDYVRKNKVLVKVSYNHTAVSVGASGLTFTDVHVQAKLNDKSYSYRTAASLNYGKIEEMIPVITKELIDKSFP